MKLFFGSFHMVTKVFSSYFTICGCTQTINETSSFGKFVMSACIKATEKVPNTIFLDHSMDGVRFKYR